MINSKKLVIAATLCAFTATFSFAQEVAFENKLSSDLVNISITDDKTETSFAGIKNEAKAEYSSEKLDLGVKLIIEVSQNDDDSLAIGSSAFVDDYFIEFRPVNFIGIGFHKGYNAAGSFLPCLEKEIEASNFGSDFGLFFYPIEGLVISGGIDFISYLGKKDTTPLVNFGAEYSVGEMLAFGAAFRNIASDDRTIGAYASFTGVEGLTLNAGFTYNGAIEDFNIAGNLINAAVMFSKDSFGINADAVFAAGGEKDDSNELYTAANVSYQFTDSLTAILYAIFTNDFDNDDAWDIGISPSVEYMINEHNTVGGGVLVDIKKSEKAISFPVFWKYVF